MSIYELVNSIQEKDIVLPAIQRDFVWDEERIELLFDSIFRGYPVGIVLLWETHQPIQFRNFREDHVKSNVHRFEENRKGRRIQLVLDGQQRLSSIYVALKGTFDGRSLYYDILSGQDSDDHSEVKYRFRFFADAEAADLNKYQPTAKLAKQPKQKNEIGISYWAKLCDLVGRTPHDIQKLRNDISKKLRLSEEDRLRMELNIQTCAYALSENTEILKTQTIDAKLPADDAKRKSPFDILEIFVRVNTQGMTLKRSDLIVSMMRLYWPQASTLLPRFLEEINDGSNLSIDNDFVIRCMFSTAGIGTRLDFELLRKKTNVDKIQKNYKRCFDAIRSAVDFVRTECAIDSARLLGGISTLVPFVQYLYNAQRNAFPKQSKADAKKALYLFAFAKTFTQHSESRTGAFIKGYLPSAEEISGGGAFPFDKAAQYVAWRTRFKVSDDRLFGNNVDLALALLQRRTGGKIKLSSNLPEIDHIFPRSVLEEKNFEPHEIDDLGNFWILPRTVNRNKSAKHPGVFLKDIPATVLRAAMIDRNQLDYRSYKTFVRDRRVKITKELKKISGLASGVLASAPDPMDDEME